MAGSSFGTLFTVTTWGESHGKGSERWWTAVRRAFCWMKPGYRNSWTAESLARTAIPLHAGKATPWKSSPAFSKAKTTGTPISLLVRNTDQRSRDYGDIASCYRPGHADYTFDQKYGFRDYRGGGRSSGRETIGRVAAGAIAVKILEELGVSFCTYTKAIGPVTATAFDPAHILQDPLYMADAEASAKAQPISRNAWQRRTPPAASIECRVSGTARRTWHPRLR